MYGAVWSSVLRCIECMELCIECMELCTECMELCIECMELCIECMELCIECMELCIECMELCIECMELCIECMELCIECMELYMDILLDVKSDSHFLYSEAQHLLSKSGNNSISYINYNEHYVPLCKVRRRCEIYVCCLMPRRQCTSAFMVADQSQINTVRMQTINIAP